MKTIWKQRMPALVVVATLVLAACGMEVNVSGAGDAGAEQVKVIGSGQVVKESRAVSGFTAVSLYAEGQVAVTQGDAESLTVTTDDNLLDYLETTVTGGVLDIRLRDGADVDLEPTDGIEVDIGVASLDAVTLYGAGAFSIDDLVADLLELNVSGAGDMTIMNLDANELDVVLAGTGSISLAGQVNRETLALRGAGNIDTAGISAEQATVGLSGVGDITVRATDHLGVTLAGIGDVRYYGTPVVTQNVTGSGKVSPMGDE